MAAAKGPNRGTALDAIARGLASGMSRREAIRAGGAALVGVVAVTPTDAWAAVSGGCPSHRVRCDGKCCPSGEVCLHAGTKHHCGCPRHATRCGTRCVQLLTDAHNCGHCGHVCGGGQHCAGGHCVCATGHALCSGTCVTPTTDPRNCGACGHNCASDQVCSQGHCVTTCAAGETNCSNACVMLPSDPNNCGVCGHRCGTGEVCSNGQCTVLCTGGTTDCGNTCVDLTSDAHHCGTCSNDCTALPFVMSAHCASSTCVIDQCQSCWAHCTGPVSNGCETDTCTDPMNCGACGRQCMVQNGTAGCSGSVCMVASCNQNYSMCGTGPTAFCANVMTDVQNCGGCGMPCNPAHATPACIGGMCAIGSCVSGYQDCNHNPVDGCEVNTNTDANNCSACSMACAPTKICNAGSCGCRSGWTICPPVTGSCVQTLTDPDNCGTCGNHCMSPTPFCSGGSCVSACPSGTSVCGNSCVDIQTDPQHCGTCGVACTANQDCVNGVCQQTRGL